MEREKLSVAGSTNVRRNVTNGWRHSFGSQTPFSSFFSTHTHTHTQKHNNNERKENGVIPSLLFSDHSTTEKERLIGYGVAVLGAVVQSATFVMVRKSGGVVSFYTNVFYFGWVSALLSFIAMFAFQTPVIPDCGSARLFLFGVGELCFIYRFWVWIRLRSVSVCQPARSTNVDSALGNCDVYPSLVAPKSRACLYISNCVCSLVSVCHTICLRCQTICGKMAVWAKPFPNPRFLPATYCRTTTSVVDRGGHDHSQDIKLFLHPNCFLAVIHPPNTTGILQVAFCSYGV